MGTQEPLTAMVDRALDRQDVAGAIRMLATAIADQAEDARSARMLAITILIAVLGLIGTIVAVAT